MGTYCITVTHWYRRLETGAGVSDLISEWGLTYPNFGDKDVR
jgi:hypothetical protein